MTSEEKIKLSTAAYTEVGKVRKANEDSYFVAADDNLIIVCDGMGGQVAGGLASKIAVETIQSVYRNTTQAELNRLISEVDSDLSEPALRLLAGVRIANRRLYQIAEKYPRLRGMGTTVVALTFDDSFATMVHVGDSRIFRLSSGEVCQLTLDHSWLNELIEDNEINDEQIETFSQKNVITRALGTSPAVKIDIHREKYKKDDIYILCTDGMHNSVGPKDIVKLYRKNDGHIDAFTRALVDKALQRDGTDNITVAVTQIRQEGKQTSELGLSTTVPEEGEKTIIKEDRFIQAHYLDKNIKHSTNPVVGKMNQTRWMTFAIALITGLFCFFLGMMAKRSDAGLEARGTDLRTKPVQNAFRNHVTPTVPVSRKQPAAQAIHRSKLSSDAVLAFVFFNSAEDYAQAMLEKRASVLDRLNPYSRDGQSIINGSFSIFLIDSTNNVIRKTTGLRLPNRVED